MNEKDYSLSNLIIEANSLGCNQDEVERIHDVYTNRLLEVETTYPRGKDTHLDKNSYLSMQTMLAYGRGAREMHKLIDKRHTQ
jgi:hypothetical protein